MTDTTPSDLLEAVRAAIENRARWAMPLVILRFEDSGAFTACPQELLADARWSERGRPYQILAELDRADLDQLAGYSDEELKEYTEQVLWW
jgi:hypothetical protein